MSLLSYLISINVTNIVLVMLPIWANDVMDNCREDVFIFIRQLLCVCKSTVRFSRKQAFQTQKGVGTVRPVVCHAFPKAFSMLL